MTRDGVNILLRTVKNPSKFFSQDKKDRKKFGNNVISICDPFENDEGSKMDTTNKWLISLNLNCDEAYVTTN